MEATILTILNSLLAYLLASTILQGLVLRGYEVETAIAAFVAILTGAIMATGKPLKRFTWLLLSALTVIGLLTYLALIFWLNYVTPWLGIVIILLSLVSLVGLFFIAAFFELKIYKLFKDDKK